MPLSFPEKHFPEPLFEALVNGGIGLPQDVEERQNANDEQKVKEGISPL